MNHEESGMPVRLSDRKCVPCEAGAPALDEQRVGELIAELGSDWKAVAVHHITKSFKFRNFRQALAFTNAVGALAEEEGHHPEITLAWGKVALRIWTHKIDGLTESDFVLAAKVERTFCKEHRKELPV